VCVSTFVRTSLFFMTTCSKLVQYEIDPIRVNRAQLLPATMTLFSTSDVSGARVEDFKKVGGYSS
jgi:hypothetical protein